jgi:hypothetical protein
MPRPGSDPVEVTLLHPFRAETEKAIGVKELEDDPKLTWLPKSQIKYRSIGTSTTGDDMLEVILPEWLAKEKGFI